jgi:hypothetical protein
MLGHGAQDADVQRRQLAHGGRPQAHTSERKVVVEGGYVRQAPAQPIERLDHDDVETSAGKVMQQFPIARPGGATAADRPIRVDDAKLPALTLDQAAADLDLILDRSFTLPV